MRILRSIAWGLALSITALGVAGCSDRPERVPIVMAVLPSATNPFWQELGDGLKASMESQLGSHQLEVFTGSSDDDAMGQIEILRGMLSSRTISAVILGPASSSALAPVVAQYSQAGIPVVVVDSRLDSIALDEAGGRVSAFIGSDNVGGARLAGQFLNERIDGLDSRVIVLAGNPAHETAVARLTGFMEAADSAWKLEIVVANWSRSQANDAMRTALAGGRVAGVFAANDEMAIGAIAALEGARIPRSEWPLVVGFDATTDGRLAVGRGDLCATIAQQPREIGRLAVNAVESLLTNTLAGNSSTDLVASVRLIGSEAERCNRVTP